MRSFKEDLGVMSGGWFHKKNAWLLAPKIQRGSGVQKDWLGKGKRGGGGGGGKVFLNTFIQD